MTRSDHYRKSRTRPKPRRAVPPHGPHAAHLVPAAASAPPSTASRARCIDSNGELDKVAIVPGIGSPAAWPGTPNLDSFHTTHGRADPLRHRLKLANPELQVVVYSGDGDLFAYRRQPLHHAARRNMDLKVICVNHMTYAMTGGQSAPTTPASPPSAPHRALWRFEPTFNLAGPGRSRRRILAWRAGPPITSSSSAVPWKRCSSARFLLHRSAGALPHALRAPQQDGRRPRRHEVLQASQQDSATSAHRRVHALQIAARS